MLIMDRLGPTEKEDKEKGVVQEVSVDTQFRCFKHCEAVVLHCNRRNVFTKPWILIPFNLSNQHWVFVALMDITYLATDQKKKFTVFMYADSMSSKEKPVIIHRLFVLKGIYNFIIFANMLYGKACKQQEISKYYEAYYG